MIQAVAESKRPGTGISEMEPIQNMPEYSHTFTDPGLYNVTLMIKNIAGSIKVKKPNYVKVMP